MFKNKKAKLTNINSVLNSKSPFAFKESYKSLRSNLEFSTFDGELKVLAFTSSVPEEGKTTTSVNTAISLAETGNKVLIVDADLRSPSVNKHLRIQRGDTTGLSTVLSGRSSLSDSIMTHNQYGFDVLFSGPIPPNPAELISHKKAAELFELLKQKYDYIIIDTPPSGVVTDAMILGQYADGLIYVVRHNFAPKELVKDSIAKLEHAKVNILGIVLNGYDASRDLTSTTVYHYEYTYSQGSK